jgi:tetratricopeptide (TPR) repeat protein
LGLLLFDLHKWAEAEKHLGEAIDLWKTLAGEALANRFNLALGYNNLFLVLRGLHKQEEAKKAHLEATKVLKQLLIESPDSEEFQNLQAGVFTNLGMLLIDSGQWREAEDVYRQAINLGKTLTEQVPAVPDYRYQLARSQFNLGYSLAMQDKQRPAEEAYRQAIGLQRKLTAVFPKVPPYRLDLANSYNNLGALLSGNNPVEAKKTYALAIALEEALASEFGEVIEYRIDLAGTYSNLANIVRDQGEPLKALAWYDKANALLDAIVKQDPGAPNAGSFLRNTCWDRANALGQVGRHAAAIKDWQRAIQLDEGKERSSLQLFLATAQMEVRLKAIRKPAKPAATADLYYEAALVHAQAVTAAAKSSDPGLQQQYATRALGLLKQARSAGFFRDRQRIDKLKKDSAFSPLRERAEFKQLLEGVEAGPKAK